MISDAMQCLTLHPEKPFYKNERGKDKEESRSLRRHFFTSRIDTGRQQEKQKEVLLYI